MFKMFPFLHKMGVFKKIWIFLGGPVSAKTSDRNWTDLSNQSSAWDQVLASELEFNCVMILLISGDVVNHSI